MCLIFLLPKKEDKLPQFPTHTDFSNPGNFVLKEKVDLALKYIINNRYPCQLHFYFPAHPKSRQSCDYVGLIMSFSMFYQTAAQRRI